MSVHPEPATNTTGGNNDNINDNKPDDAVDRKVSASPTQEPKTKTVILGDKVVVIDDSKPARVKDGVLSGIRCPIFLDLVHNNARSHIIMCTTFALIVALVAVYFIQLSFGSVSTNTMSASFFKQPPSSAYIGVAITNFSVVVRNVFSKPLSGALVTIDLYPVGSLQFFGHTVDCVEHRLSANSYTYDDLDKMCNPSKYGYVLERTATTGSNGVATFGNLRLTFGGAVLHTIDVVVKYKGQTSRFQDVITMTSPITSLTQASVVASTMRYNQSFRVEGALQISSASLAAAGSAGVILSGMCMSLNLQSDDAGKLDSLVYIQNTNQDVYAQFQDNMGSVTMQATGGAGVITIPSVRIYNSLLDIVYLGLFVGGSAIPINVGGYTDLTLPIKMSSSVAPTAGFVQACPTFVEENSFFQLSLQITPSTSAKMVSIEVQSTRSAVISKRLVNAISSSTDTTSGIVAFSNLYFTQNGDVATYTLLFQLEGRPVLSCAVAVGSSVNVTGSSAFLESPPWENDTATFVVGEVWAVTPRVYIAANNLSRSMSGKRAQLSPADSLSMLLEFTSVPANTEGWAMFEDVRITYAAYQGIHLIHAIVDKLIVQTLQIYVTWQVASNRNCSAVRVPVYTTEVDVGFTTQIQAQVVTQTGEGAPLQAFSMTVGIAPGSEAGVYTYSANVPSLTDVLGYAFIPRFTVTTLSIDLIFLQITLTSGSCSTSYIMSAKRRASKLTVSSVRMNDNQNFYVSGTVQANWETVRDTDLLYISAKLLRAPSYVYEHSDADLPVSTYAGIATSIDPLAVQIQFLTYCPGQYVFVLGAEGTYSQPFTFTVPEVPITLTLDRSGLLLSSKIVLTYPIVVQPKVSVTTTGGTPVANARVRAMLAIVGSGNTVTVLDYFSNSTLLSSGAMGNLEDSKLRPYSIPSDSKGSAVFSSLSVLGGVPGITYTIVYKFGATAWVKDSGSFVLKSSQVISGLVVSLPSIFAVPGQKLSRGFTIAITYDDGTPVYKTLGIPVIYSTSQAPALSTDSVVSNSAVMSTTDISFSSTTPSGKYRLAMRLPGGVSSMTTSITVTREPYSLDITTTIPSVGVIVGYTFSMVVQVRVADGAVVPFALVLVEIQSSREDCVATQCGVLDPSASAAYSDENGNAKFSLTIMHAEEGTYSLRFYTAGSGASTFEKLTGYSSAFNDALHTNTDSVTKTASSLGLSVPATATSNSLDVGSLVDQASSSATTKVQSSLLATYASSALVKRLQQQGQIEAITDSFKVWNRVSKILIVREAVGYSDVGSKVKFYGTGQFVITPKLLLLDRFGNPLPGKSVDILVLPTSEQVSAEGVSIGVSDKNGYFEFLTLKFLGMPVASNNYHIMYLCEGASNTSTIAIPVESLTDISFINQYTFELLSGLAFVVATPFFISNYPQRNPLWAVCGIIVLLIPLMLDDVVEWYTTNLANGSNIFLRLHLYMILFVWSVLMAGMIFIFVNKVAAIMLPPLAKWYESKRRTTKCLEYGRDIFKKNRKYKTQDCIHYPMKFLIAMVVSIVIIVVMTYFSIFVVNTLMAAIQEVRDKIPEPPTDLTPEKKKQLNKELQVAIKTGLSAIASLDDRLSFLLSSKDLIDKIDVFDLWETVFYIIDQMLQSVFISGVTAITASTLLVTVNMVFIILTLPKKYLLLRQNQLPKEYKARTLILVADKYIGMQAMHFVLGHQLVFFLVFLVTLILSTPYILYLIVRTFYMTILLSLVTVIASAILEKVIIGVYVVRGRVINHPGVYSMWSVWAMIVSVANGVSLTIARFITAIFAISVFFARLDMDLFPEQLLMLDVGFWSFYSVILVDEEYNNPIALSLIAALTAEWTACRARDPSLPGGWDESVFDNKIRFPHMKRMVSLYFDKVSSREEIWNRKREVPLPIRRVECRFRLWVLLLRNPSLQELRKNRVKKDKSLTERMGDMFQFVNQKWHGAGAGGAEGEGADPTAPENKDKYANEGVEKNSEEGGGRKEEVQLFVASCASSKEGEPQDAGSPKKM